MSAESAAQICAEETGEDLAPPLVSYYSRIYKGNSWTSEETFYRAHDGPSCVVTLRWVKVYVRYYTGSDVVGDIRSLSESERRIVRRLTERNAA